jgi:hypothetical protein
LSKLTAARSNPIAAFDDAANHRKKNKEIYSLFYAANNQHCAPYLQAPLVFGSLSLLSDL